MAKPNKHKQKTSPRHDKHKSGKQSPPPVDTPTSAAAAGVTRQPVKSPPPSQIVTLAPLAPLIVRSGRPFDEQTGADPARFPPPSTLAGCLRTAWARATGTAFGVELSALAIAGPLLVRVDDKGKIVSQLVPKPADAHYFGQGDAAECVRAEPRRFETGCGADVPDGLLPLRLTQDIVGKASEGPKWWAWDDLIKFRGGQPVNHKDLTERGWSPPAGDRRTHVAIDERTLASETSRLFQTEGLDFAPDNQWLKKSDAQNVRLLAKCDKALSAGLVHLGGERRLARLHPELETAWPEPCANWFAEIAKQSGLTLTLLTPAVFKTGYRPGWLNDQLIGSPPTAPSVQLQLVAAAVERWQPNSGWDLAKQIARPTRKLVAAGATYWFKLIGEPTPDALTALWLTSICDESQDQRDGYGLALPAPWSPVA